MHKVAARHLAAIESGRVERGNLIGIRKMLSAVERKANGRSVGRGQALPPPEDLDSVLSAIIDCRPVAVGDLHAGGLAVLRNKRNRRKLERVADIAPDVVRFRLVGYEVRGYYGDFFVPIWRAETADGRAFTFRNIPWQSGGDGPEILGVWFTPSREGMGAA